MTENTIVIDSIMRAAKEGYIAERDAKRMINKLAKEAVKSLTGE